MQVYLLAAKGTSGSDENDFVRAAPLSALIPSDAQIEFILKPSQTVQERNVSSGCFYSGEMNPIVMRTYYMSGSDARFLELLDGDYNLVVTSGRLQLDALLNDSARYNFGPEDDAWAGILTCIPDLVDDTLGPPLDEEDAQWRVEMLRSDEQGGNEVDRLDMEMRRVIFVLDEQAFRTGRVRLLWLGANAQILREDRWMASDMQLFDGMYQMFGFQGVVERAEGLCAKADECIDVVEWEPTE